MALLELRVSRAIHGRFLLTDHGDRFTAACIACLELLGEVAGPAELEAHEKGCGGEVVTE